MIYHTRKIVKPGDLNPGGVLFGGQLLNWIDEEAAIYVMCQLNQKHIASKYMSEILFLKPAVLGDIVEIGFETIKFGISSITVKCEARIKQSQHIILTIEEVVFVNLDENHQAKAHGISL